MSQRIALVGCGKLKLTSPAPAKELYVGNLFMAARKYAELRCDRWLILSALHGVVEPSQLLAPYECRLSFKSQREGWGWRVRSQLEELTNAGDTLVYLAGADYEGAICFWNRDGFTAREIETPLDGMGIGQRLKWLRGAV